MVNRTPRGAGNDWLKIEMAPFETITIDATVAACDGGGGGLGHPKVYLSLAPSGRVECPYCSRLFVNRAPAADDSGPPSTAGRPADPG